MKKETSMTYWPNTFSQHGGVDYRAFIQSGSQRWQFVPITWTNMITDLKEKRQPITDEGNDCVAMITQLDGKSADIVTIPCNKSFSYPMVVCEQRHSGEQMIPKDQSQYMELFTRKHLLQRSDDFISLPSRVCDQGWMQMDRIIQHNDHQRKFICVGLISLQRQTNSVNNAIKHCSNYSGGDLFVFFRRTSVIVHTMDIEYIKDTFLLPSKYFHAVYKVLVGMDKFKIQRYNNLYKRTTRIF